MKIKERALSILLSLVMVLTFMPALAFAEGDEPADVDSTPAVEETADEITETTEEPAPEPLKEDLVEPEEELLKMDAQESQDQFDPNATVELIIKDDRDITCDYTEGYADMNFPVSGDKVKVTYSDGETKEYIYDGEDFVYSDEDWLRYDISYPTAGATSFTVEVWDWVSSREPAQTFEKTFTIPVTVNTVVTSITFSPSNTTVLSTDIAVVSDGYTYYDLYKRNQFIDSNGDQCNSLFKDGDSITVNTAEGSKVYTYQTKHTNAEGDTSWDWFWYGDESFWPNDYDYDGNVKLGQNNSAWVMVGGCVAYFNIFVDTPELIAQRQAAAAEAVRQGTPGSLPKVKASKPKASKKAITVKWKKLSKKQLKSGVTNIEIWVSADGSFANGSTIERFASKKKSSLKIKGLAKGKYHVWVRSVILNPDGTKVVGPWSKKTVKVKK